MVERFGEQRMRPYVDGAQKLPPAGPRLAHPRTRAGIAALHGVARVLGSRPVQKLAVFDRLSSTSAADFVVPDHAGLTVGRPAPVTRPPVRPAVPSGAGGPEQHG